MAGRDLVAVAIGDRDRGYEGDTGGWQVAPANRDRGFLEL